jgi:biopolymer transport protein ExbD
VSRDALQSTLDQLSNSDRSMRIFLRADKTVPYGDLMDAMNALRTAGYLKVALVGLETDVPR